MDVERRIVNDHVFLLGLDNLYREAIKRHDEIWTTSLYRDVSRGGMECLEIIDR